MGNVASAAVASLAMTGSTMIAHMQGDLPMNAGQQEMMRWAVQVGGPLFLALLIILWFYRKDFKDSAARAAQRDAALLEVVRASTAAMTAQTESSRHLTQAVEEALERLNDR